MRWWAASPSPNCKSTTLSIPNCLDYQTIVIIKIMSIKPILLDMHQTLVVDVFSQLHWKSRRCWILWPFKFCSMQPAITKHYMLLKQVYFSLESPCAWLYQEHYFLVRLVQFDQISLVVNIVHLILCVLFWKQLQCSHTWLTRIPTYCCNSSKMEMMSKVVNLIRWKYHHNDHFLKLYLKKLVLLTWSSYWHPLLPVRSSNPWIWNFWYSCKRP